MENDVKLALVSNNFRSRHKEKAGISRLFLYVLINTYLIFCYRFFMPTTPERHKNIVKLAAIYVC